MNRTEGTNQDPKLDRLDLEGNVEKVAIWLSQIDAAGNNARFIGPHITAIRVGSYPPTFVENLHTLDEDTVLALAASKSSIWSQPIKGVLLLINVVRNFENGTGP